MEITSKVTHNCGIYFAYKKKRRKKAYQLVSKDKNISLVIADKISTMINWAKNVHATFSLSSYYFSFCRF